MAGGGRTAGGAPDDFAFLIEGRIIDQDLEQEPVELCLGERVSPFVFDGVLSRVNNEGFRQGPGVTGDRDLFFLHRLEQGRLCLGRCAVDLVGQDEIGKHRPGRELERAPRSVAGLLQNL